MQRRVPDLSIVSVLATLIVMTCLVSTSAYATPPQFLDEEQQLELLEGSEGWTWIRIYDPQHPGAIERSSEALIIRASHLDQAPVPELFKDSFRQDYRHMGIDYRVADDLLFTSREALDRLEDPELGWCSPYWTTSSRSFSRELTSQLGSDWSESFEEGGLSAEFQVDAPTLEISFAGAANFRVKRGCFGVPIGVVFEQVSVRPRVTAMTGAKLQLRAEGQLALEREWMIHNFRIGGITFWIGPIPVYLGFSSPLRAGLSVEAEASVTYTIESSLTATAGLDFECTKRSCQTFPNVEINFDPPEPELALEGEATGRAWIRPGLRISLYHDSIAYAEASGRLFLQGDLWGYLGNSCGDSDGNNVNEWVKGLSTDLSFGVEVDLTLSGLGQDATWTLWEWDKALAFYPVEFFNYASPFEPYIEADNLAAMDNQLRVGETGAWKIGMRSCYPYSDDVTFRVEPAINGHQMTVPPEKGVVQELSFQAPGQYSYQFTAQEDAKGRTLNKTATLDIDVEPF